MFVIFSITILSAYFFQFPLRVWNTQLKSDCYESFTNPPIYLNVNHDFPTGPVYFTAEFYYERYSILPHYEPETEKAEYNFKKIDKICNSSIIFTTMGEDLEKLHVEIRIHIFFNRSPIAYIFYNFYKSFKRGNYNLMNGINSFSVNMAIVEIDDSYLTTRIRLFDEDTDYIKSISGGNSGEICIHTLYNKTIILKPNYRFGIPSGLVYGIEIYVIKYKTIIEEVLYAGFECKMHKKYNKDPLVFIKNVKKSKIIYNALYVNYMVGERYINRIRFEITYPKYEYVDNLRYISQKYKIIFLMNFKFEYKKCSDGSNSMVVYFQEGKRLLSGINKILNISTGVEYKEYSLRKTVNPCDE